MNSLPSNLRLNLYAKFSDLHESLANGLRMFTIQSNNSDNIVTDDHLANSHRTDFFTAPCTRVNGQCRLPGIVCKSALNCSEFGLCDDPSPSDSPAYTDTTDSTKWIAQVSNPALREVTFKAIDNCVEVLRPDGTQESRCDGMLIFENNLIFVELKDRGYGGWQRKGKSQLAITIAKFQESHNIMQFSSVEAYICNKQRPLAVTSIITLAQEFRNETGFILKVDRNIRLT